MKQLNESLVYRAIPGPPRSTKQLRDRFPAAGQSVNSLLRLAGPFKADRDGFRFSNSPGQAITLEDARILRGYFQSEVDDVAAIGVEMLRSALRAYTFSVPLLGATGLPGVAVDYVINQVSGDLRNKLIDSIVATLPGHYGRCGGMAFAGYDFFLVGWSIPPDTVQPGSGPLRDYIWRRLIDSLVLNASTFLEWTMVLHILPVISKLASAAIGAAAGTVIGGPIGAALGALLAGGDDVLGLGGADALLDNSRDHWTQLKRRLDEGAAWPLGIIHGSNANPVDQHQILALKYTDNGNGTAILWVWDNNAGPHDDVMQIDMRSGELNVSSSSLGLNDTKGLICEAYTSQAPPPTLHRP